MSDKQKALTKSHDKIKTIDLGEHDDDDDDDDVHGKSRVPPNATRRQ